MNINIEEPSDEVKAAAMVALLKAKLDYWDACNAFEEAVGMDIIDHDDVLAEYAAEGEDPSEWDQEELLRLVEAITERDE